MAEAGLAALCLWAVLPAAASPRLTLRLENVTLHETLRQLQAFYGRKITGSEGAGTAGYLEADNAARSTFNWKDAGVGAVCRDVSEQFQRTPRALPDGSILFNPGAPVAIGLVVHREGVSVALLRVRQREVRSQAVTASRADVTRTASLALTVYPLEGDPNVFFSLDGLRATDNLGNELRPTSVSVRRQGRRAESAFPDEWPQDVTFSGVDARARTLVSVQGDVILYRSARTHRIEVPLGEIDRSREWEEGPLRLRSVEVRRDGGALSGACFLAWPRDVEVDGSVDEPDAAVILFARMADGSLVRLPLTFGGTSLDDNGEHSAQFTLRSGTRLAEEPTALVWDVTARSRPERHIPFRFTQIPLPLDGGTDPVRGSPVGVPTSLVLAVPLPPGRRGGELTVGISGRAGKLWGPVRWSTVESDDEGEARLEDVSPGVYRLQVSFRPRDSRGNLGRPVSLRTSGPTVATVRDKATRVPLAR